MRRYLSWIEGLTTNQYVGGSNPSRRTTYMFKPLKRAAFLLDIVRLRSVPYSRLAPDAFTFIQRILLFLHRIMHIAT